MEDTRDGLPSASIVAQLGWASKDFEITLAKTVALDGATSEAKIETRNIVAQRPSSIPRKHRKLCMRHGTGYDSTRSPNPWETRRGNQPQHTPVAAPCLGKGWSSAFWQTIQGILRMQRIL